MSEQWIIVVNWERFQHYRDRSPAWIKTYLSLLDNPDYLMLSFAQRGLLHGLWIAFASHNGVLSSTRSRTLLSTNKGESRHFLDNLEALTHAGFIEVSASRPVPIRYPRERERERDTPYPAERGVENGTPKANPRALGTNPRAQGTNPRAVAKRDKTQRHDAMVELARRQSESWVGRTDRMHENLDRLEAEYGAIFTDQERTEIIDGVLSESVPF